MNRTLFTLAFPELRSRDRHWLEKIRHDPDPAVEPHFTVAFGVGTVSEDVYLKHVAEIAAATDVIAFHCRRVALGVDHRDPSGYAFLVPDEGNSAIFKLHDQLYSGPLAANLKLEVQFVPHLTLGRFSSLVEAKHACDRLNAHSISIAGELTQLTVVAQEDGQISDIASFPFRSHKQPAGRASLR